MNVIKSYKEFLEFLRHSNINKECIIPIVLIKPSTVLLLNRDHRLDHLFDYYDERTGRLKFFLPGYNHNPQKPWLSIYLLMDSICQHKNRDNAIRIHRLGDIQYDNHAFTSFVDVLEHKIPDYHYYGDTELLFIKFIPSDNTITGDFDFQSYHVYNISALFHLHGYHSVERFIQIILKKTLFSGLLIFNIMKGSTIVDLA